MLLTYSMVAMGGALGAVCRFALSTLINERLKTLFPFATLSINVLGSMLMGVCFVMMTERIPTLETYRPLIMVGFLGAFTTFSTFSLEIVSLIHQQAWLTALSYLLLSCFLSVLGLAIGILLTRTL
ncbi:fluoride efflux transporter CrcB [Marinomonas algicola]|jgi:fluoride exporter|uniref:fluoride efflux transporter CrcB n=1 Tax=Marinomonas algicola TaxID=2773454 RepID=UPI0017482E18|nr:fluoride efflux transporter CrcB [Marinomonas algicola]